MEDNPARGVKASAPGDSGGMAEAGSLYVSERPGGSLK